VFHYYISPHITLTAGNSIPWARIPQTLAAVDKGHDPVIATGLMGKT